MDKIFTTLRRWLAALGTTDRAPDQLSTMSLADYADLPSTHPLRDE
jgi:hypothetical protein